MNIDIYLYWTTYFTDEGEPWVPGDFRSAVAGLRIIETGLLLVTFSGVWCRFLDRFCNKMRHTNYKLQLRRSNSNKFKIENDYIFLFEWQCSIKVHTDKRKLNTTQSLIRETVPLIALVCFDKNFQNCTYLFLHK